MRFPLDSWQSISTHFGDPVAGSFFGKHLGTDFVVPVGTPVKAPVAGTITATPNTADVGLVIEMTGDDGMFYRFLHLSKQSVTVYMRVAEGQTIALSGNTGSVSTGPHLHNDIRYPSKWNDSFSNYVDPEIYLKKGASVPEDYKVNRGDIINMWRSGITGDPPENYIKTWENTPWKAFMYDLTGQGNWGSKFATPTTAIELEKGKTYHVPN